MIERREWRYVGLVSLAVVGLSSLPAVYCQFTPPPGTRYSGLNCAIHDQNTYIMWIEQAREGRWVFEDRYTTEPSQPGYFNLQWLAIGRIARWFGISSMAAYQASRVLFSGAMVFAFYFAISQFVSEVGQRRLALLLLSFGSGLGWLPHGLGVRVVRGADIWMPEAFPLSSAMAFPHFCLSWGLIAVVMAGGARAVLKRSWRAGLAAAGAVLILGFTHTYHIVPCAAGVAVWALGLVCLRRISPRHATLLLPVLAAAVFPVLYWRWAMGTVEWMREWSHLAASTSSGPVWEYLIAFGPLLGLAALARRSQLVREEAADLRLLLICWSLVLAALLYWPWVIAYQRRFAQGLALPLTILAVQGFTGRVLPLVQQRYATLACAGLVMFAGLTHLVWLAALSVGTKTLPEAFYLPADQVAGMRFLAQHAAPGDAVMCDDETGLWLPGSCGVRTYVGSHDLTLAHSAKLISTARFFSLKTSQTFRSHLLRQNDIRWIWVGNKQARRGGLTDQAAAALGFIRAYKNASVVLYRRS